MQSSNGNEKSDSVLRFLKSFLHLRKTLTEAVAVSSASSPKMADSYLNWNFQGPLFQLISVCKRIEVDIKLSMCAKSIKIPPKCRNDIAQIPQPLECQKKSEPSNACPGHWAAFEVLWVLVVKSLPVTLMRIQQIGSCCLVGKCILDKFHTKTPQQVTDGMQSLIGSHGWHRFTIVWFLLICYEIRCWFKQVNHRKKQIKLPRKFIKKCGDQKLGISSRDSCSCIIITLWQSPWCCKQPLVFGRCKFWIHKNERWLAPPKSIRLSYPSGFLKEMMSTVWMHWDLLFFAWIPRCSTVQSS